MSFLFHFYIIITISLYFKLRLKTIKENEGRKKMKITLIRFLIEEKEGKKKLQ